MTALTPIQALKDRIKRSECANDLTRAKLFDRYMSEPYGDEVKGQSQFVSSDVWDAVETIFPEMMDLLATGDDTVVFTPVGPEDEEAAKQETQAVNHIIDEMNDGFGLKTVWGKEGLIQQVSYVQAGWETRKTVHVDTFTDMSIDEIAATLSALKGDYDLIGQEETENGLTIKVKCVKEKTKYIIRNVPIEQMHIDSGWHSPEITDIPFIGRVRDDLTIADLIEMGFDRDSAEAMANSTDDSTMEEARQHTRHHDSDTDNTLSGDARKVTVGEWYIRADLDGDGVAEMSQIWANGDGSKILTKDGKDAVEIVDHHPFRAWTPFVVPHRHIGRSVAEIVEDVAKVKTVLTRQTLDNIYKTGYPRPVISGAAMEATYSDLMNPAPGAPIRAPMNGDIRWDAPPDLSGLTFPMIEQFNALKEERIGVSRLNQGLDGNTLNKTATGAAMLMTAGQKKIRMITRNFAAGIRGLCLLVHADMRRGPMRDLSFALGGNWVQMDPTAWRERTDMRVLVGSGAGDREAMALALEQIAAKQAMAMEAGLPIVGPQNLYETARRLVLALGLRTPELFFTDPKTIPPAPPEPPPPDPMMFAAETDRMSAQAKAENDARVLELQALKHQDDHEARMMELNIKHAEVTAKILAGHEKQDLERDKATAQDDRERDKADMDFALKASAPPPTVMMPRDFDGGSEQ